MRAVRELGADSTRSGWLVAGLAALLAVLLALVATQHGAGVSPDSTVYLSGARNLAAGRGYVNYSLQPITEFPVGFSATLALGEKVGIDARDGARWLNAFAFGALVLLTFALARRHLRQRWLAVGAAGAVAGSAPLLVVFTQAWTEPVFCILVLAELLVLERLTVQRGRGASWLVTAGLLTSAACAYRYSGLTLVVLCVLVIGVAARADGFGAVLRRTLLYLSVALVLPALIIARNLSEGSSAFGPRGSSIETLGGLTRSLAAVWRAWVLAGQGSSSSLGWVALAGAAAILGLGLTVAYREHGVRLRPPDAAPVLPLLAFIACYLGYLVVSEFAVNINEIDGRLLSPTLAPVVVLFTVALDHLVARPVISHRRWLAGCIVALLSVWVAVSLAESINRADEDAVAGQGYAAPSWTGSPFVAAFRKLPTTARTFSDYADGLYSATGDQPVYDSPSLVLYRSRDPANQFGSFRRLVRRSRQPVLLIWLNTSDRTYLLTPAQLRQRGLHLTVVTTTSETTVYAVRG